MEARELLKCLQKEEVLVVGIATVAIKLPLVKGKDRFL